MKRKKQVKTKQQALAIALLLLFALVIYYSSIYSQNKTPTGFSILSLNVPSEAIGIGERLLLNITAANITNLGGIQLSLRYNPNVLRFDRIAEGTFLSQNGLYNTQMLNTADVSQPGIIKDIVIVRIAETGTSGQGRIASIYFTAINEGVSNLQFENILLSDMNSNPISPANLINANVTVAAPCAPSNEVCNNIDDDCDGVIDNGGVCAVKCWSATNMYLARGRQQFKKFCKCAQGTYAYKKYGSVSGTETAYKYVDAGNNNNWTITTQSQSSPASRVRCADNVIYYTNADYYR